MKITLNGKQISIEAQQTSVAQLLKQNLMPASGIAVALNDKVVRKTSLDSTFLHDGDSLTVITAVCGG